ncbi:hypothetical protein [Herbaspirillum sp. 1130]|uniref:hypothetical protein n=1 Tax=Herbaspirillum sp. 1130 TaxID=2806562 RepID=UPI001AE14BE9|nr:hypothetical protein [Herbaspirillum sp. 1130]MBP1317105.1 putative amidohydrolase [Herbaspirillum sp. 1130]
MDSKIISLEVKKSKLALTKSGLRIRLLQAKCGCVTIGDRDGLAYTLSQSKIEEQEVQKLRELLGRGSEDQLTIMSYHPGISGLEKEMRKYGAQTSHVIALAGPTRSPIGGHCGEIENVTLIRSGDDFFRAKKLSLASEDIGLGVQGGETLHFFEGDDANVSWAVLNCHEYTHVDILEKLLDLNVELLVVVTYNVATRLYWEYAVSDVHRLFCFVIIVNVAELGGSGIFAPFRRIGAGEHASLNAGGQLFGAKGSAEVSVLENLDIGYLRELREKFQSDGAALKKQRGHITTTYPSQRYYKSDDNAATGKVTVTLKEIDMEWESEAPTVAVCQLESMPLQIYLKTEYRLDNDKTDEVKKFCKVLDGMLAELTNRIQSKNKKLDFLVLPEVFVPRSYIEKLKEFSKLHKTVIIAGVDYPSHARKNQCFIIDSVEQDIHIYTKVTRSQYDALNHDGDERLPIERGNELLRFKNKKGHTFGVLICYDYSHLELIKQINEAQSPVEAVDVLFVVAHNPFGELYRSSCIADSHRFYQHIVMCNVSSYGGSGVFAPTRGKGARQVLCESGKGTEAINVVTLALQKQRTARQEKIERTLHEGEFMRKPGIYQKRFTFKEKRESLSNPASTDAP